MWVSQIEANSDSNVVSLFTDDISTFQLQTVDGSVALYGDVDSIDINADTPTNSTTKFTISNLVNTQTFGNNDVIYLTFGYSGAKGQKGQTGGTGPQGGGGPKGEKGQKGQKGEGSTAAGPKGIKGAPGPTGPSGAATTINNNADNRVITGDGTANTLNAEANMTFNGSTLEVTGNINATADITAYYSSDERFKNNIITLDSVLDKFNLIRGVRFDWNENSSFEGHDIGVIAQEIENVFPELVKDREDGYKGVRYEKLVAVCIQAIKELKQEIDRLKNEY